MPNQDLQIVVLGIVLVFLLKITAFVLGYLTIRLGYQLIADGAKGEFNFSGELIGAKAGLVSMSPGLLFVVLGTFLIGYAIFVDKETMFIREAPPVSSAPAVRVPQSPGDTLP